MHKTLLLTIRNYLWKEKVRPHQLIKDTPAIIHANPMVWYSTEKITNFHHIFYGKLGFAEPVHTLILPCIHVCYIHQRTNSMNTFIAGGDGPRLSYLNFQ